MLKGNYGELRIASVKHQSSTVSTVINPHFIDMHAGVGAGADAGGNQDVATANSAAANNGVIKVAVKTRLPNETDASVDEALLIEGLVLHAVHHPRVLGLVGVSTTRLPFMIITELMVNGDLKAYLRACRPEQPNPKATLTVLEVIVIVERIGAALAHLEKARCSRFRSVLSFN
jgi:hypothetical protein